MSSNSIYCVYLTTYLGDKLPRKYNDIEIIPSSYFGSSSIDKIQKGYRGSVCSNKYKKIWKQELKESPQLFDIQIISYHDTRPEATYKELQLQKMFNVVKNPIFINMAYATSNGCFGMPMSDELKLAMSIRFKDKKLSPEHIKNVQLALLGRIYKPHSDITKEKIRKTNTGKKASIETREKISKNGKYKNSILSQEISIEAFEKWNSGQSYIDIKNWLLTLNIFISIQTLTATIKRIRKENGSYFLPDQNKLSYSIRTELVTKRESGNSYKEIKLWLESLNFFIVQTSLPLIYKKHCIELNKTPIFNTVSRLSSKSLKYEIINKRKNGDSPIEIYKWLLSSGETISFSAVKGICYKNKF